MSIFSRQQPQSAFGASAPVNNERLEQAALEVDMVSDLFNRLVASCHAKCIPSDKAYHEGTLNKGEGVCIDRCVAKYFAVNEVVGQRMQAQQELQAKQQQAASGGGKSIGSMFGF